MKHLAKTDSLFKPMTMTTANESDQDSINLWWALDALSRLRDASIRYRLGVYGQEELKLYEERAERILKNLKPLLANSLPPVD